MDYLRRARLMCQPAPKCSRSISKRCKISVRKFFSSLFVTAGAVLFLQSIGLGVTNRQAAILSGCGSFPQTIVIHDPGGGLIEPIPRCASQMIIEVWGGGGGGSRDTG